jgi:non-specific serine/threonine protein kinase
MSIPETLVAALADRYRIERLAGQGGMATVYLAHDLKHRRNVAIKVLRPEMVALIGPRFRREIEMVARLTHPHIIPLFDSGQVGDLIYYVMPFIEGESLRGRLTRERQLKLEEALRLTREIAGALGHAHQQGLVHRDIKPENILLAHGMALVADFGIARGSLGSEAGVATEIATAANLVIGTPRYMSPEQITGGEVDARSDQYSLACVLYEMLSGEAPFVGESAADVMRMHLVAEPPSAPEVPPGLANVITKALAKRPGDRYPDAILFVEALDMAMQTEATPLASKVPNNLPKPRTRFIGRERELTEAAGLLSENRMLTLTGIGGSGKTRLALRIGEYKEASYPDGVWFVDLASLSDGGLVPEAVAARLGVSETPGKTLTQQLAEFVKEKRLLIVLDNCEHLLSAAALLADTLLSSGEHVAILATSREGLGVEGERQMALRSLSIPTASNDLEIISASEAVTLFVDRARLAANGFDLTEDNASAIAEICRRLDGIPLAIELAAARVKMLSVDQIRAKLDDRFRLLVGSKTTALPRHQTLRATIQWSYDQLTPEEQQLFRSLSVFSGGWSLETAARLLPDLDEMEVMERFGRLIDKSLVIIERDRGDARYGFLETVRQYAQERLVEAGESLDMHRRHLESFIEMAEQAYADRFVKEEIWGARLEMEHDNLRVAIERAKDDSETYLQLVGTLAWFFQARSHFLEGRAHLTAAVAATPKDPPRPARARALWGIANTLTWQGDGAAARPWMQDALQTWRALGDRKEIALALEGIGWAHMLAGQDPEACATFEESLALFRDLGDRVLVNRAMAALGQALVALHRVDEARSIAKDLIAFSSAEGDKRNEHSGWHYLADCALIEGKCDESLGLYKESLRLAHAIGDRLETCFEIQGVAMSLAGLGQSEPALRLAAAVNAEWARLGVDPHMRFWDELLDGYLGKTRSASSPETAKRIEESGRRLSFEDAIQMALDA